MKKYNRSEVMSRAWKLLRRYPNLSWRTCMIYSWDIEKKSVNDISPKAMNQILNGLRGFNRSRSLTENKPMLAGTQEHFKILNSRKGRKIMKLSPEDDARVTLENGVLFLQDILHQRRKESKKFILINKKIKTIFRNRIINQETCVPINIEEYVNRE